MFEAKCIKDGKKYVLKRATDYGEAEYWMNSRLQIAVRGRAPTLSVASRDPPARRGDDEPSLWLVWSYEGERTLFDLMKEKNFPYNVEPLLFAGGQAPGGLREGPRRKSIIIGKILDQILDSGSLACTLRASYTVTLSPRIFYSTKRQASFD